MGSRVLEAADTASARELILPCDLALIDMVMPGESGMALLPEIGRDDKAAIMVTAGAAEAQQLEAMRRGSYDVLHKAVTAEELVHAVKRAAERVRLAREIDCCCSSFKSGPGALLLRISPSRPR